MDLERIPLRDQQGQGDNFALRMVRFDFKSVDEAKKRAIMLMLATYNPLTWCGVIPMGRRQVQDRILVVSTQAVHDLLKCQQEQRQKQLEQKVWFFHVCCTNR